MTVPDPNAQPAATSEGNNAGNSGQTDYQAAYTHLMTQLKDPNGPYVERKVYTGLQQTYQKEFDAHKTVKDALAETTKQLEALQTQLQGNTTTAQLLQREKGELEQTLAKANTRLGRLELIGKEFPELISWEAQGLLPDAPIEKLPDVLKLIHGQLETKGTQTKEKLLSGVSLLENSNNEGVTTQDTAASKLAEYNRMILEGPAKQKEADKIFDEYLALKAKEDTAKK